MKYRVIIAAILAFLGFWLAGCVKDSSIIDSRIKALQNELAVVHKKVEILASQVGIPKEKIKNKTTNELLLDIEIKLDETYEYTGKILTDEEMWGVSIYLNDQVPILKKITSYQEYIKTIRNKKVIVLSESSR